MIEQQLCRELQSVAARVRRLAWHRNLRCAWLATFAIGALTLLAARWLAWPLAAWGLGAAEVALVAVVAARLGSRRTGRDLVAVARLVEERFPDLDDRLLAAIEQRRQFPNELGYLQEQVIREALEHSRRQSWKETIAAATLARARRRQAFTLAASIVLLAALAVFSHHPASPIAAIMPVAPDGLTFDVEVEPGESSVERGTDLLVTARYRGPLPATVTLQYQPTTGTGQTIRLTKSLEDPLFGGRIVNLISDGLYWIESDGAETAKYRVTVFDYPRLERADARLAYPAYTGLAETVVEDTERVTAVEGTEVTLVCRLNKPVATARLVGEDETAIPLAAVPEPAAADAPAAPAVQATFTLQKSQRLALELIDDQGRRNKHPTEFVFEAVPNRRPELKLAFPGRDLDVSPLQEVAVEATVWDDFGLAEYGLTYTIKGRTETVVLGQSAAGGARQTAVSTVPLEPLGAQPDDLLTYHFWAEDIGPDGKPRRTAGDLYFAEVRRFEEIFRQGEQPSGGQMQGAGGTPQETMKLAELQKQIVSATWKLLQRDPASAAQARPDALGSDIAVVRDSQKNAAEQTRALQKKLKSPEARQAADEALAHMTQSLKPLAKAVAAASTEPLNDAIPFEQAAYQALLKLRAREHRVVQGQSGGGGGGGGSAGPSQQQLQQLKLDNQRNRYESQRSAQTLDNPAQRENRQILSRLKELAQRQEDVNQRLKELQAALDEAKTEAEREKLRRELKRLREQEQELLRDVDELRQRAEQAQNQSELADARQQLNQTRENVRRSSEALEKGMVPQALSSGTRAERQLEQLRDEFRKRLSGQFGEAMRQMRQESRELAEKQNALDRSLTELDRTGKKSLRDSGERQQIAQGLEQQKGRLGELLDDVRQVTEQAETAEPLLARQLYDTYRKTAQQKADEALALAAEMLRRGFPDEARQVTPKATKAIDELKEGVERAAQSVLGDDVEALRLARSELDALAEALRGEMDQTQGERDQTQPKSDATGERQGADTPRPSDRAGGRAQGKGEPTEKRGSAAGKSADGQSKAKEAAAGQQDAKAGKSSRSSASGAAAKGSPSQQGLRGERPAAKGGAAGRDRSGQSSQEPGTTTAAGERDEPGSQRRAPTGLRELVERGGIASGPGGPITGPDGRNWSDRLRDVEELLEEPALRSQAAEIRQQVRQFRADFQRHSKDPQWPLVEKLIARPLDELRQRVAEELSKREQKDSLVPIDRDPVPVKFSELVRRYYEALGEGK